MTQSAIAGSGTASGTLPYWLDQYTTDPLYGLAAGTGLSLVALFTNPAPAPSFPWAESCFG